MAKLSEIIISEPEVAHRKPFIYVIYTLLPKGLVYVGQTEDRNGAIGRLANHMKFNPKGTFIEKCSEEGIDFYNELKDIHVLAFDLSEYKIFTGDINKKKRNALEYKVHFELIKFCVDETLKIPYTVVSHVKINTRYIDNSVITGISSTLANQVKDAWPFHS